MTSENTWDQSNQSKQSLGKVYKESVPSVVLNKPNPNCNQMWKLYCIEALVPGEPCSCHLWSRCQGLACSASHHPPHGHMHHQALPKGCSQGPIPARWGAPMVLLHAVIPLSGRIRPWYRTWHVAGSNQNANGPCCVRVKQQTLGIFWDFPFPWMK